MKFIGGNSNPSGYEDELKNLIKKHRLEKQVILAGTTNNVTEELLKASIFVFPSAYEGFPLAMTEAMSAGLPVVGFNNALAVNEMIAVGENGFLSDYNTDAFAACLEKMINNEPMRLEMGATAIDSIKAYSADTIYGKWDSILMELNF